VKRVEPIMVVILSIITFGIYALYWLVSTKHQANALGAKIPTCWLLIVPIINYYWLWKFSEGIEYVTNKKVEGVISFIALLFLSVIGMAIVQSGINNAFSETAGTYQAPQQTYQAPPQSYNAPPPPPPGTSSSPPPPPPPPKSLK
jgi:UDP-N-acetylmuramyl pentapeptide phosphotransferase/UDP-N-acetylglucosamine-1-phosphate transferase